jgi:hypothetical protein
MLRFEEALAVLGKALDDLSDTIRSGDVGRLEREIAFTVFVLKSRRLTSSEQGAWHNYLARAKPRHTIHTRIDDLMEEISIWRASMTKRPR